MNSITKGKTQIHQIVLTNRDTALLGKIGQYRAMNTDQIKVLFFGSLPRARRRLRLLCLNGYLRRTTRPVRQGEGSSKFIYSLTSKAIRYLTQADELTPGSGHIQRSSEANLHTERINDFRICLELANRRHDPELIGWREGRDLKLMGIVEVRGIKKSFPIIPDALFTVAMSDKEYSYFLEIDRGTTDLKRIVQKCLGYLNLFSTGVPKNRFRIRSFRVLFVTTSRIRIQNILERLNRLGANESRLDLFHFTDFDSFSLSEPERILEPIWQTIGSDGKTSVSRPLPSLPPSTLPTESGKPPVH